MYRGEVLRASSLPPVPTNEFGVVEPPPPQECMGDECYFLQNKFDCIPTRHHLHHDEPTYELHSELAKKFRNLELLTVWMYSCRHKERHDCSPVTVPVPGELAMKQAVKEARIIKQLDKNYSNLQKTTLQLTAPDISNKTRNRLQDIKYKIIEGQLAIVERVETIEVIPAELVTGALILSVPWLAEKRLRDGGGLALTGTQEIYNPISVEAINNLREAA